MPLSREWSISRVPAVAGGDESGAKTAVVCRGLWTAVELIVTTPLADVVGVCTTYIVTLYRSQHCPGTKNPNVIQHQNPRN